MVESSVTIRNSMGIHVRPAGIIAEKINSYPGSVCFVCNGNRNLFSSVLDIIAMGLQKGDTINIQVSGQQENRFLNALSALFEKEFDFPPCIE